MNANILYNIYTLCANEGHVDIATIGMAKFRAMHPEITDSEAKAIREFVGKHGKALAKAFHDKDKFTKEVELAEILDQRM